MKKVFGFIILMALSFILIACGDTQDTGDGTGGGDGGNTTAQKITIMHGAPYEVNPFDPNYSGKEQRERQALQKAVEEKYNIRVEYKPYPDNAAWGPNRINAIIQASVSGTPLADIYWTTSDWTQQFVNANAIANLDKYLTLENNLTDEAIEIGSYNGSFYAMSTYKPTNELGLYYNLSLVEDLGLPNPTEMYLNGEWTWTKFEQWALQAKALLAPKGEGYYVLGSQPVNYARNMVYLNGGTLINFKTNRIGFHQTPALQTYEFLTKLYNQDLFEKDGNYDSGSAEWKAGQVIFHPGDFWFLNADNRWKGNNYDFGFVPYPASDTYKGEYAAPKSGLAVYTIAAGMSAEKEELAFKVWNELQLWKTDEENKAQFRVTVEQRLDHAPSVEALLSVWDKTNLELIDALGISSFDPTSGFNTIINKGIKEANSRTAAETIQPIYEEALKKYNSGT